MQSSQKKVSPNKQKDKNGGIIKKSNKKDERTSNFNKFTPLNLDNKVGSSSIKKKKKLNIDSDIQPSTVFQSINTPTKQVANGNDNFTYDPKKFREMSPEQQQIDRFDQEQKIKDEH